MFRPLFIALAVTIAAGTVLFMDHKNETAAETLSPAQQENPLLAEWKGPYGGVLPFDKVRIADFKPSLERAMSNNLAEIDKIASNPAAPTFENTFIPLEESGQELSRASTFFSVWSSSMNTAEFQPVQAEMQPKLAAHYDKITQNAALFKRIETVYKSPATKKLTPEQQRLVKVYYDNYVHAGAALDQAKKTRLSEINQQLAGLYTKFNQNLQGEEGELFVQIDKESDLSGLPQSLKEAAAEDAKSKGKTGWIIRNTRSSTDPFLTYADNRGLRHRRFSRPRRRLGDPAA